MARIATEAAHDGGAVAREVYRAAEAVHRAEGKASPSMS